MPLHLYPDVYASGSVLAGWVLTQGGTIKSSVRNPAVRFDLRELLPGRWLSSRVIIGKYIILNIAPAKWPALRII